MWSLKYEFRHDDCEFLEKAMKLQVTLEAYPLQHYVERENVCLSLLCMVHGTKKQVNAYIRYLRSISLDSLPITNNTILIFRKLTKNDLYYRVLYNAKFLFPVPILHANNKETAEILSWNRSELQTLLHLLSTGTHTTYFKLLHFKKARIKNFLMMQQTSRLSDRQSEIFSFARNNGYYTYPRNIDLARIAARFGISKSTCHEILRRAEGNILNL